MEEDQHDIAGMDWRVALGFGITTIWISAGVIYLVGIVGLDQFIHLPTGDIGSFLEGAFAPLAFLWLVIGHFMQQKEISANTRAIGIQEQSARRLEVHSQRDSYFKLLSLVQEQLGNTAALHFASVCGPTGTGEMTQEEFFEQRTHASKGDPAWFVRRMIALVVQYREDPAHVREIFYGTDIRRRHSENFVRTFRKLLDAAREVDTEEMVTDALLYGSASGFLYRVIAHVRGDSVTNPIDGLSIRGNATDQPPEAS